MTVISKFTCHLINYFSGLFTWIIKFSLWTLNYLFKNGSLCFSQYTIFWLKLYNKKEFRLCSIVSYSKIDVMHFTICISMRNRNVKKQMGHFIYFNVNLLGNEQFCKASNLIFSNIFDFVIFKIILDIHFQKKYINEI